MKGNINYLNFKSNFEEACINKAKNKIRFVKSISRNGRTASISYGYFDLDENGTIIKCERGYSTYKGFKVTELDTFPKMMMFGKEC